MAITYHAGRRVQGTATDFNSGTITRIGSLSHAETAVTGSTTWTYTHTNASGSNRIMLVSIGTETGGDTVSGIDYGGQALVKIANALEAVGKNNVSMWYLLETAIAAASNTTITVTQPSNTTKTTSGAISYEGVDQSSPISEYATDITAVATHTGLALTEAVGNLLVVITGNGSSRTPTYPATMTEQYDSNDYAFIGTSLTLADRLSITDGSIDPAPTMSGVTRNTGISVEFTAYASNNIVNVQVGSRYEETDTRKMYHYNAPQAATDTTLFSTISGWTGDTSTFTNSGDTMVWDTNSRGEAVVKTNTTLSASGEWVLRFKVTRVSGDAGDGSFLTLGSSSASTSTLARMQDGNGLYPYGIHVAHFANANVFYIGGSHDASFAWDFQSNANVSWATGDTRWVEVSHASSTAYTTKVYSNANFTGTPIITSVASPTSQTLDYDEFAIGTKWGGGRKNMIIEDMQIWTGVTTPPSADNTWSEEGT
jgi:hypothetical protein